MGLCAPQFDVCNCTSGDLSARMAAVFTCCLGCCGDGGPGHAPLKEMPTVQLDTHHMGKSYLHCSMNIRSAGSQVTDVTRRKMRVKLAHDGISQNNN